MNRLYDPLPLHSTLPHLLNLLNLLVAGLIAVCCPFLCLNSAFSRHFYTFYGSSVQAMDIRLNGMPIVPSALGSFLAAGTPRFSDLNEGDNAPCPTLHGVPSPVEEAIRIIPLFRLIEIESAQPALLRLGRRLVIGQTGNRLGIVAGPRRWIRPWHRAD